jgi:hypothetical protein
MQREVSCHSGRLWATQAIKWLLTKGQPRTCPPRAQALYSSFDHIVFIFFFHIVFLSVRRAGQARCPYSLLHLGPEHRKGHYTQGTKERVGLEVASMGLLSQGGNSKLATLPICSTARLWGWTAPSLSVAMSVPALGADTLTCRLWQCLDLPWAFEKGNLAG